jgi:phosphoribosylaminoimidazolecarboxamide formyltransferase/IMP cyclohydrolase
MHNLRKFALFSLSKKHEIMLELAKKLKEIGYEIICTKGTYNYLKSNNVEAYLVDDILGLKTEYLKGKIKTINPLLHSMILADRENTEELNEIRNLGLIDYVVVNFYELNFSDIDTFLSSLDLGGRALINSAIKNYKYVTIAIDEEDATEIIKEIELYGKTTYELRKKLALKSMEYLINYEVKCYTFMNENLLNNFSFFLLLKNGKMLRYGENPHQKAFLFNYETDPNLFIEKLAGEELSYNNLLDIDTSIKILSEFNEKTCAIIKHTNPCGVYSNDKASNIEIFLKAYEADSISAYGGDLAMNFKVDKELAEQISNYFFDIIIAKDYEDSSLEILRKRKKTKIIACKNLGTKLNKSWDLRSIVNGILVQERDLHEITIDNLKVVSKRFPTEKEIEDMIFAWKVVKHVDSNAIVVAKDKLTLGIGCGQPSRIDATKLALSKANVNAKNAVLASDGFFPFRDSIDLAASYGISAIIEPGGSIRDKEIIEAANEHNISLVFTNIRCFKH